jgi:Ca2+:H+ antiporter
MAATQVRNPFWSLLLPIAGLGMAGLALTGIVDVRSLWSSVPAAILLMGSVFAAVHHAEIIATRVGEPFGSIVLAVAITVIEVGLILTLMLAAPDGGPTVARDTVYSAIMIILSGVAGLCILLGSRRHFEQTFQVHGTTSALATLATLAVITLVLPNFTTSSPGPTYSTAQLGTIAAVALVLYGTFLFVQTVRHRDYFVATLDDSSGETAIDQFVPSNSVTGVSAVLLCLALLAVVVLAKMLSDPIKNVLAVAGLPQGFIGVIIATLVLLPESIAAARSALANNLQTSLNLALGSGLASIGLTIPAVAIVASTGDHVVHLGVSPAQSVMLILTLFISVLTLANGRTNLLLGVVHLSLFGVFLVISAVP